MYVLSMPIAFSPHEVEEPTMVDTGVIMGILSIMGEGSSTCTMCNAQPDELNAHFHKECIVSSSTQVKMAGPILDKTYSTRRSNVIIAIRQVE